jgi:predicted MPP superfamily phosphohydrolase
LESEANASGARRRQLTVFLTVLSAILLAVNWFVGATLAHFWRNPWIAAWQWVSIGITLAFVASMLLGMRHSCVGLRIVYRTAATWLGFLHFGFFAAGATWLLVGANFALGVPVPAPLVAGALFGSAALLSLYGLANAAWLRVTEVTIHLPNLPAAWQGRTAALVSDMHLGNVRGLGLVRRVVALLERLEPDAVFLCGDLFDGAAADYDALMEPWKKLARRTGIYFVTGNHEEFSPRSKYVEAVARAGIRVLGNEMVELHGLQIAGVLDRETHQPEVFRSLLGRMNLDRNRPSILLTHQPLNLSIPAEAGVSLQLCGHTHRGQVWPWHWLAARVHGRFVYGLHRWEQMQVLTSSGAGTWGPPLRVNTRSEIVLIRFEG